jgi:hypothetical protein
MQSAYQPPEVERLGTLAELTAASNLVNADQNLAADTANPVPSVALP